MIRKSLPLWILFVFVFSGCASGTETAVAVETSAPTPVPTTPARSTTASCTNSAEFVSDVTVPDGTVFEAGDSFNKIWRIKNTGTCAWSEGYNLVFTSGGRMGAPNSVPLQTTHPGNTLDVAVDMIAPDADGLYRADFELRDPDGESLPIDNGTTLWVSITVGTGSRDSGSASSASSDGPGFASVSCPITTNQNYVIAVINAINALRAQNNLPALNVNTNLAAAAQAHSDDMACNNLFVHQGSNGSTPQSRALAAGYSGTVTENVYGRNPTPTGQEAVTWWATDQSDPNHSRNLLTTRYTEIGVGYSYYDDFGYYAVVFGVP